MGGKFSHEFHVETPSGNAGEDVVAICQGLCDRCGWKGNQETLQSEGVCPSCQGGAVKLTKGIEIKKERVVYRPLQMGCYGLGPTRLMAASVEALSTEDNIRWPRAIAPLVAAVIPPKEGSKEQGVTQLAMDLADQLASSVTPHVALDDRTRSTIGYRLNSLRNIGVPFAIIVAKKVLTTLYCNCCCFLSPCVKITYLLLSYLYSIILGYQACRAG
ncbi:PARS2 [Cordylochernes scorpioides]|uniref:PARS2 n=1 Tax=Cordylochernes scorpioides TaxID=51811 RepID=A0ABY6KER9_9ARAC|nr:PARS2 [Cordylochernes scorpioides]